MLSVKCLYNNDVPDSRDQQGDRQGLLRQLGFEEFEAVRVVVGEQLGGDDAVLIVEVIRSVGGVELLNDGDVSMNGLQVNGEVVIRNQYYTLC